MNRIESFVFDAGRMDGQMAAASHSAMAHAKQDLGDTVVLVRLAL